MAKKIKKETVLKVDPIVPVVQEEVSDNNERKTLTYVVVREGYRVSDKEYEAANDPVALSEKEFWTTVADNHSYGEPVQIVPYDAKKHRVW